MKIPSFATRFALAGLQSAKGIVRREKLLKDATFIMNAYASDAAARRRRLEIQYAGESGFDASSGEQAGVTRGFYADVAREVMLVGEGDDKEKSANAPQVVMRTMSALGKPRFSPQPLWIADTDPSGVTVIPTPRANPNSLPGLFPRPIHSSHPDFTRVCTTFRMLGRLFSSALRDGFLIPLPLSLEFIKLVQSAEDFPVPEATRVTFVDDAMR